MRDWLKEGGAIPADQNSYNDLIGPETVGRVDGKIQIEAKADMKRRGLPSPNRADALAISFAWPVSAKSARASKPAFALTEYDPFGEGPQNQVHGQVRGRRYLTMIRCAELSRRGAIFFPNLLFAASGCRFWLPLLVAASGCRLITPGPSRYPIVV